MTYAYPYISYKKTINGVSQTVVDSINYSLLQDPTNPTIDELNQQDPLLASKFTAATGNNEGWPYYKKYNDPQATAQLSNSQILVYRYADFLLLMADVYNEMGQKMSPFRWSTRYWQGQEILQIPSLFIHRMLPFHYLNPN